MTKTCRICGTTSDASEFYAGINNRCKECHKARVKENRIEKADYYRAYDAQRFRNDPRVRERHRRYQSTPAGLAALRAAQRKWDAQNPDKRAAHIILNNAVRDGRKTKSAICESCGAGGVIHGHHDDYTKPLDVVWLCPPCHKERHK